jgi:hypothetical protein
MFQASNDAVFLQLDDGNSVQVSKKHLSLLSPVFDAMFRGDFRDAHKDSVQLREISHWCLTSLVHMTTGCSLSHIPGIDLSKSLQLISVLDRLLVAGGEDLIDMIVQDFLSHNTAVDIYIRCMETDSVPHFHTLRYATVRYMLTSYSESSKKTEKLIEDFLHCPYKKQVLTDITDIFQERLNYIRHRARQDKLKKHDLR